MHILCCTFNGPDHSLHMLVLAQKRRHPRLSQSCLCQEPEGPSSPAACIQGEGPALPPVSPQHGSDPHGEPHVSCFLIGSLP